MPIRELDYFGFLSPTNLGDFAKSRRGQSRLQQLMGGFFIIIVAIIVGLVAVVAVVVVGIFVVRCIVFGELGRQGLARIVGRFVGQDVADGDETERRWCRQRDSRKVDRATAVILSPVPEMSPHGLVILVGKTYRRLGVTDEDQPVHHWRTKRLTDTEEVHKGQEVICDRIPC